MKHAREDYNRIQDPLGLIPDDEPVFLLRGQDKLAPDLVRTWAIQLFAAGGDPVMAGMALEQSEKMQKWQEEHKAKLPDLKMHIVK
jgi:hypothetical protein